MVLAGVGAADHEYIGVAEVDPVIGHSSASVRAAETGDCGGVSYSSLVFYIHQTQGAGELDRKITLLVVVGSTA